MFHFFQDVKGRVAKNHAMSSKMKSLFLAPGEVTHSQPLPYMDSYLLTTRRLQSLEFLMSSQTASPKRHNDTMTTLVFFSSVMVHILTHAALMTGAADGRGIPD